jgi:quercetin dioxygenase-like cupin family protein
MLRWTILLVTASMCVTSTPVAADVITDWNQKAVAFVQPRMPPPQGHRATAMVHLAMFDAVNAVERRYRPYLMQPTAAPSTSKEAAAAVAASAVLTDLLPQARDEVKAALAAYLETVPSGNAKTAGIELGEMVAAKLLQARAKDGSEGADNYRPKTRPGVYIPTPLVVAPMWGSVKPFAMTSPSQFRPEPPLELGSEQWAADYNEIKELGSKSSDKRSAKQTEDARFWLVTGPLAYDPIVRQLVATKKMRLVDSARFMALTSVAMADALIAVLDAKYHYDFWRPITAIRNGDLHDNAAVKRHPTWQPIDNTPMHPEYSCAHCILAASFAAVAESVFGTVDVPEVSATSPTAPGVTHRWTNLQAFVDEVSEARIWAGFHYRFSTRVGQDMGHRSDDTSCNTSCKGSIRKQPSHIEERTMKIVRREFMCLTGAAMLLPADTRMVLAQASQPSGPKLTQILRGDLVGQDQKVQETMVTIAELGPQGQAPWHMHPGAQELLYVLEGRLIVEVEGRAASTLNAGEIVLIPAEFPHFARNESATAGVRALIVHSRSDKDKPRTVPVKRT